MFTNEIKKGTRVKLSFMASMGQTPRWEGTVADNARGIRRMVKVEGFFTETGSVWSHDITHAEVDKKWVIVEHTKAQLQTKLEIEQMG